MTVNEGNVETETLLTSAEVARLLQVDATSIINWSKKGYLKYYRTPGGHRRIRAGDVVAFVRARQMPVPAELAALDERRLLVALADSRDVKAVKKNLEPFGTQVRAVFASSLVQALVELALQRPHVLVLDAALDATLQTGAVEEAAAAVRRQPELKDVQVLVLDGKVDPDKLVPSLLSKKS
jgi:excisionase family DNA binding protein